MFAVPAGVGLEVRAPLSRGLERPLLRVERATGQKKDDNLAPRFTQLSEDDGAGAGKKEGRMEAGTRRHASRHIHGQATWGTQFTQTHQQSESEKRT